MPTGAYISMASSVASAYWEPLARAKICLAACLHGSLFKMSSQKQGQEGQPSSFTPSALMSLDCMYTVQSGPVKAALGSALLQASLLTFITIFQRPGYGGLPESA